ncbi:MAG: hypothetical protein O4807_11045 [Trichodesmium sp. St19_bin2]|nr:hypothetical protein [Trichodesmium sp. St19_bin2]
MENGFVEIDDKISFPVYLNMVVEAFNGNGSLGDPQTIPATENY